MVILNYNVKQCMITFCRADSLVPCKFSLCDTYNAPCKMNHLKHFLVTSDSFSCDKLMQVVDGNPETSNWDVSLPTNNQLTQSIMDEYILSLQKICSVSQAKRQLVYTVALIKIVIHVSNLLCYFVKDFFLPKISILCIVFTFVWTIFMR